MLESRAERSALGASLRDARHSSSRRRLEFSESKNRNRLIPLRMRFRASEFGQIGAAKRRSERPSLGPRLKHPSLL